MSNSKESPSQFNSARSQPDIERIREIVIKEIESKLSIYRNIGLAFLIGFGGFLAGLIGWDAIKELVRDHLLAFSEEIDKVSASFRAGDAEVKEMIKNARIDLEKGMIEHSRRTIAFTYGDQFSFVYDQNKPLQRSIPFFAKKNGQKSSIFLSVQHYGAGEALEVSVKLDKIVPIWNSVEELDFTLMDITDELLLSPVDGDIHVIDISIKSPDRMTDDVAYVKLLVNISGPAEISQ